MATKFDEVAAYQAMTAFLEKYYRLTHADEIGALLGSMQLMEDRKPADPAIWDDWLEAVRSVRRQERIAS
jgi:hypothetical protein